MSPKKFTSDLVADDLCENGYSYVTNFLSDCLLQALLSKMQTINAQNALQKAKIGCGSNQHLSIDIRNDKIHWIEGQDACEQEFLNILENLRINFNSRLILGLFDIEAHYALYEKGRFYRRHLDSFMGKKSRIVSLVIYFNKDWQVSDGGLLQLYRNNQEEEPFATIIPEYNHAVFFLSEEIPHEVTISHKNRLSIACWFRCRDEFVL